MVKISISCEDDSTGWGSGREASVCVAGKPRIRLHGLHSWLH